MADSRPQWMKSIPDPISRPQDMDLDGHAFTGREHVRELFGKMSDEQRDRFIDGIVVALWESQDHDDLRPVVCEVMSWYASLLMSTRPGWDEHLRKTEELKDHGPSYTAADLRAMLARAEAQIGRESGE